MTTTNAQYKAHQASIRELMATLEVRLAKHETKASADPGNWGYVGDLGYIETDLKELVKFLGA